MEDDSRLPAVLSRVVTVVYDGLFGEAERGEERSRVMGVFATDAEAQKFISDVKLGGGPSGLLRKRWRWALCGVRDVQYGNGIYEDVAPVILLETQCIGGFGVSPECVQVVRYALERAAKQKKQRKRKPTTRRKR